MGRRFNYILLCHSFAQINKAMEYKETEKLKKQWDKEKSKKIEQSYGFSRTLFPSFILIRISSILANLSW